LIENAVFFTELFPEFLRQMRRQGRGQQKSARGATVHQAVFVAEIYKLHQRRNRGIEMELFNIFGNFFDCPVEHPVQLVPVRDHIF